MYGFWQSNWLLGESSQLLGGFQSWLDAYERGVSGRFVYADSCRFWGEVVLYCKPSWDNLKQPKATKAKIYYYKVISFAWFLFDVLCLFFFVLLVSVSISS